MFFKACQHAASNAMVPSFFLHFHGSRHAGCTETDTFGHENRGPKIYGFQRLAGGFKCVKILNKPDFCWYKENSDYIRLLYSKNVIIRPKHSKPPTKFHNLQLCFPLCFPAKCVREAVGCRLQQNLMFSVFSSIFLPHKSWLSKTKEIPYENSWTSLDYP